MHKRYIIVLIFISVIICGLYSLSASADGGGVVISQVQTRSLNGGSASEELIELYNNSDIDVDISGWCIKYGSSGSVESTKNIKCIDDVDSMSGSYIFIPKRSSMLLVSTVFATNYPDFGYDLAFSGGMSDSERWLSIVDAEGVTVDLVEWGTEGDSVTAEGGLAAPEASYANLIQRKSVEPGQLQDTNNNSEDFEQAIARTVYGYGSLYEVEDVCLNLEGLQIGVPAGFEVDESRQCGLIIIDYCPNLEGVQSIVPDGSLLDENGDCQVDVCLNLSGLQIILPDNMEYDFDSNCVYHDECDNLAGPQATLPDGYKRGAGSSCLLDLLPLRISEILPNAIGVDDGNEFIELYNPNSMDVLLDNYQFYIGSNVTKLYDFPVDVYIGAGQYMGFLNSDINFTLVNSTSHVTLVSRDGQIIDETLEYSDPDDGMSWAFIDDSWQYTNRPTFGGANLESQVVVPESTLLPCPAGQYRNPETNRCRLISPTTSQLVPCKDGQYRSEITNRCRNIATDVVQLVPCAEGEERNPETNRCRKIVAVLGATSLAPCPEGQERNADTNRCRKIVGPMPLADYAPSGVYSASGISYEYWSLAGIGLLASVYAIWEWRSELYSVFVKLKSLLRLSK